MRRSYRSFKAVLIGLLVVRASSTVCADGWKIQLQGGRELGTSYAGRSVLADDASVVWFNPAAMSWLTGDWVLTVGAPVITYQLGFSDAGSVSLLGQPLKGATTQEGGQTAAVPHVYLVKRLNSRWWGGFGFNAPYGLGTNWGESWVGRYFATETTLRVFNLNPAFAVRPTPRVAIGFGLDVQRSSATLANMIDFGSIGAALGLPLTPQAHDGRIQFTGGDWAAGFDLSVAWDAARDTRVGAAYRSRIDHTLAGTADFTVPPEARPLTATGLFANTGAQTVLPMPNELSVSASHALQNGWLLLGDVTWTDWSRFQQLKVTFDNPSQPAVSQPAAWNDSIRFAAGARKAVAARWTLNGGAGYETTPVPDSTRNARLPEENHAWFSVGAGYQRSEARHFDVYFSHLVTPDATIRIDDPSAGRLAGSVHWRSQRAWCIGGLSFLTLMTFTRTGNRTARRHVVDYYDHCGNDYRILWRTDENGSIHFGFFDVPDRRPAAWLTAPTRAVRWCLSVLAAAAAGCLALLAVGRSRETAIRLLRFAAGGRTSRHDAGQIRMTAVCAEMVAPRAGDRLLDAGCGVGGAAVWLASQFGAEVYGINVNHPQLVLSRRRVEAHSPARVCFSVQDYTEMGIADHSFDIVWGLESICHCEDKEAFVREAYRVLRHGGRLMVADFFQSQDSVSDADASRIRGWTKGWAIPNLAPVNRFEACLAACGFSNIRYRDIRLNVLPSSWRLYKASLVAEPIHRMLERAGFRSSIQGGNVRAARGQYETLSEGIWTYGIFVAEK